MSGKRMEPAAPALQKHHHHRRRHTRIWPLAVGAAVLAALERYAASQPGWVPAPHNYEGLRYSVPAVKGWFLLRMSLHDPLMPLNIESDCPGGAEEILRELAPFLKGQAALDTAQLG